MTSGDEKLSADCAASLSRVTALARVAQAVNQNRDEAEAEAEEEREAREADRLDGLEQFDDEPSALYDDLGAFDE